MLAFTYAIQLQIRHFKADYPTCLLIRRSVCFTDTGRNPWVEKLAGLPENFAWRNSTLQT